MDGQIAAAPTEFKTSIYLAAKISHKSKRHSERSKIIFSVWEKIKMGLFSNFQYGWSGDYTLALIGRELRHTRNTSYS